MSENKAKTPAEQAAAAQVETPEPVKEQAVPVESEMAEEAAAQSAAPAEPQEDPAPASAAHPKIVVMAPQGLNLREGPHVSYAAKAVLPDGDPVEILDLPADVEVPGWALVKTASGTGWVNTTFLTEAEA